MVEALELCDRGFILETGRVGLAGAHDALADDFRGCAECLTGIEWVACK